MGIFARRRIQTMLDDLGPLMDEEQSRGLVTRATRTAVEMLPRNEQVPNSGPNSRAIEPMFCQSNRWSLNN